MKTKLLFSVTLLSLASLTASAQCITMTCPSNISVANDPNTCGANVSYTQPVVNSTCTGSLADTFLYTGAAQTYQVPAGVTMLTMEVWGAQGGSNWVNNTNFGGYAKADMPVTPGEILTIYVGGQATTITGGFNGGGNGEGAGKGGGGASDVRRGSTYANRIIVAGGGGGAGYWSSLHVVGGAGGGANGSNGYRDPNYATNPGGLGATTTAAGANGTCVSLYNTAMAGGFGYGGSPAGCGCEGYGGGGGWYGGAGSGNCRGGGGGSGYIDPSGTNTTTQSGVRAGNGMVILTMQGSSSPTLTQTSGLPSGSLFPVGTTTNTFLAADPFGNTQTCSFIVTVTDNSAPVFTNVPNGISQNTDPGQCGAVVSWPGMTITDNCTPTVTSNYNSGDLFPVGTSTVTVIAADPSGNTDSVSFTVTVTDNTAPVITNIPSNMSLSADSNFCGAVATWNAPSVSEGCSYTLASNYNSGDTLPVGITVVTYIATDASGNSDTASFTVVVSDDMVPVLSGMPSSIQQNNDSNQCGAVVMWNAPVASDNCSVSVTSNYNSGDTFPIGTTTVTYVVSDASGNSDSASFTVTVTDAQAPVINCPQNMSVCEGVVTFNTPVATDNCAVPSVVQTSGPQSGAPLTPGTYTIVFTATDSAGNSSTCSFDILVNANPVVSLVLTMPSTVCLSDGAYTLSGGSPAGGTYSGNGVSAGMFTPSVAGTGNQTITYIYTDTNGCEALATDLVNVSACVGIAENGTAAFRMFPNPASGSFSFLSNENGRFELCTITGEVLTRSQIVSGKTEISLSGMSAGVYMVRFTGESGQVSTGRLVIEK